MIAVGQSEAIERIQKGFVIKTQTNKNIVEENTSLFEKKIIKSVTQNAESLASYIGTEMLVYVRMCFNQLI